MANAQETLKNLGFPIANRAPAREDDDPVTARLLLDLSDLFFYLRDHHTVSGIQRVALGISRELIEGGDLGGAYDVRFIVEAQDRRRFVEISRDAVRQIDEQLRAASVDHDELKRALHVAVDGAPPYLATRADVVLVLGAFWLIEDIVERLIELRRRGAMVGLLVHDLIAVTHPEYCDAALSDAFTGYLHGVLSVCDFVLTVSDYSGRAVAEFMVAHALPPIPIRTLRSAHLTWEATESDVSPSPPVQRLLRRDLAGGVRPYVLYVSTIEVRKNHIYLFRIWRRLEQALGDLTPRLVFVGRYGWRVRDLLAQLESTRYLAGKIVVLDGLSDAELVLLYRSALFTTFPSFIEGWGLPIGESLSFGRPCAASNAAAIPEVGGDFVDYFDPHDVNDGYRTISRLITDEAYRDARAAAIRADFQPRRWRDVAADLLSQVETIVAAADVRPQINVTPSPPMLRPGQRYLFGHRGEMGSHARSGAARLNRQVFDAGWYPTERFGRWMKGRAASIQFALPEGEGGTIFILLELNAVPWLAGNQLSVTIGELTYPPAPLAAGARQFIHVEAQVGQTVMIEFELRGAITPGIDARTDLTVGLAALTYALKDDLSSRLGILEQLAMRTANVARPELR